MAADLDRLEKDVPRDVAITVKTLTALETMAHVSMAVCRVTLGPDVIKWLKVRHIRIYI